MATEELKHRNATQSLDSRLADGITCLGRPPKLLFLAWYFPPVKTVACVRTWNVAKYLARLGWEITVVTPHPSIWRHVENAELTDATLNRQGVKRILTGHQWRCLISDELNCPDTGFAGLMGRVFRKIGRTVDLDNGVGWIKVADRACAALTPKDVDVILATGSPFSAFKLARRLSDRLGRPYVLDYRDPWTENPHATTQPSRATIREEAKLVAGCAAVTIVSRTWATAMEQRFQLGAKLNVVSNGYDPEDLLDIKPYDFGHYAIVYTGSFYLPKRAITPVMASLKSLKDMSGAKGSEWFFHYYGSQDSHVREEATRYDVMDRVVLHGMVPRTEALAAVRGATVAVVITSVSDKAVEQDKGMITGKVFESLGLGTPTLLIAPPGSDATEVVEATGMGRRVTGTDIQGITHFFLDVAQSKYTRGACPDAYSWPALAGNLDGILRQCIAPR